MKAQPIAVLAVFAIVAACSPPPPAEPAASASAGSAESVLSASNMAAAELSFVCGDAGKAFAAKRNFPNIDISSPETILRDAEADFVQVYGKANIESEKPLKLLTSPGAWVVEGQLPPNRPGVKVVGGVAMIAIDRKEGKVLCFIHGE